MKRLKFVFFSAIAALMLFSCQKDMESPTQGINSISEYRAVAGEEEDGPHNPKVKDIDILVSTLGPIFADYDANALFKDLLNQVVIESTSEDDTYYCFPIEEYKNVTYKVLVKFNQSNEMVNLGIIRVGYNGRYLQDFYEGRVLLGDFKGIISSYGFHDFMSNRRAGLEDCIKIVFCDQYNSGGGPSYDPNPGNDDGTIIPNGGVIFINDDSTSGGVTYVAETRCGCSPSHVGGRSNPKCDCRKPDIVILVPVIHTLVGTPEIQTRDDYWDCIDILLGAGLITDEEILAKRLKDCDLATEPYDVEVGNGDCGPGASTDDSDPNTDAIYPDTEFCLGWLA